MRPIRVLILLAVAATSSGCMFLFPAQTSPAERLVSQDVSRYLYPQEPGRASMPIAETAELRLPLRFGIAFLPDPGANALPEDVKLRAMHMVRDRFAAERYVGRVTVLPTDTLSISGGASEVRRVSGGYGLDVMVLMGTNQWLYLDESPLSILDLTVVGAYMVPSHGSEVRTSISATAVHVPSGRLLLSANGADVSESLTTRAYASEQLRHMSWRGVSRATDALAEDLEINVDRFRASLREDPSIRTTGAGSVGWFGVLLMGIWLWRRQRSA